MPLETTPAESVESVDVVVVGAGIAGLSVARSLVAAGLEVAVFEARPRVGGRLRSPELANGAGRVDVGATWFWPGEERVARLVRDLGVRTHDHFIGGDAMYQDQRQTVRVDGNPIDVVSSRFTDGAESLAEALADRLPDGVVRANTSVDEVRALGAQLIVSAGAAEVRADHVVLALPPALAMHRIAFQPALPLPLLRTAAETPVWMGAMTKVVAHFDQPFWRADGLSGSAISHRGPMRELHDMSGPGGQPAVLFGFVPFTGRDARVTEVEVRRQLAELFGPAAAEPVEVLIVDWHDAPDASPPGVERLQRFQTYGHSIWQTPSLDGRLHWASTETSTVAPGHIEGALAAAERAVASILEPAPTAPQKPARHQEVSS